MTASIQEVQVVDVPTGASSTSLATSLLSSDVVIIVQSKGSSGTNTVSMNGSAITPFASLQNGVGATRLLVYEKTGLTGSHSVSYSFGSFSGGRVTIYVLRGLTNPVITNSATSVWDGTATSANTDEGTASLTVGAGQVAIAAGAVASGTITFPSNSTPASWTNDRVDAGGGSNASVSSYLFTAAGSAQVNVRSASTSQVACALYIVGDASSVPSLTSTFVGWGNPIF